jgi:hypothetical protein
MKTSAHQRRLRVFTVIVTVFGGALALAPSALAEGATTSVPGVSDTLAQTASQAGDALDAASDAVNGAYDEMPLVAAVPQPVPARPAPAEGPSTDGGQAGGSPGSHGSSESQQGTVPASSESGDVSQPKPPPAYASNSPAGSGAAHGGKGSGGHGQNNSTSQSAASSATTIQIAPINVVILIGSNGAVHVANIASANSSATNTNGTIQVIGAPHPGGAANGPANGPANGLEGVRDSMTQAIASLATNATAAISVALDWNWDWNWTWDPSSLPGWSGSRPPATNPHGHGDSTTSAHRVPRAADSNGSSAPALDASGSSAGNDEDRSSSSSIVQIPAKQPVFPAVDGLPAPGAPAGGGISTFTLLVGALAALLFQFVSAAGLLGRRLSLAGMGWQRQAFLSPPQRPG